MTVAAKPLVTFPATPEATPADQIPNPEFAVLADDATIERTVAALRAKQYAVHVVEDAAAAKELIVSLVPEGAEVNQGASETLEDLGVTDEIENSGRFDAIRPKTRAMDRTTPEGIRAMRKLGGTPDYFLNSAHALTEDGTLVIASNTGSQLGPLAFGAGEVIFAIGTHKIVPDLATAMRRIDERSLPLEHARMQKLYGVNSSVNKILIINKEFRPGRFTIVLIKEPIGA
jgi:hypothetical protein